MNSGLWNNEGTGVMSAVLVTVDRRYRSSGKLIEMKQRAKANYACLAPQPYKRGPSRDHLYHDQQHGFSETVVAQHCVLHLILILSAYS